ncbi:MAG: hypothetical protein ABIB97_00865 [Patescibacteria group bacterium]
MQSVIKKISPLKLIVFLLILLVVILYSNVLLKYPYQEGGDLFFHTWFSNQISETGQIPQETATASATSIYSYSPLFHIFLSSVSQVTGTSIPQLIPWLNILLVLGLTAAVYILSNLLLNSKVIALLAALLFITRGGTVWFIYFLPRSLSILIFLILLITALICYQKKFIDLKKTILLVVLGLSLILTHLFNATFWTTLIIAIALSSLIFVSRHRKFFGRIIFTTLASIILFAITFSPVIFANKFPIDPSDTSWEASASSSSRLSVSFSSITGVVLLTLLVIGLLVLLNEIRKTKAINFKSIIFFVWLLLTILMLNQGVANYNFFPGRYADAFILPATMVAALGFSFLFKKLAGQQLIANLLAISLVVAVLLPLIKDFNSVQSDFNNYGFSQERIDELINLQPEISQEIVLSDPITMYYLISISNTKKPFEYEHTQLTRQKILDWPITEKLIRGDAATANEYAKSLQARYVVVSSITQELFAEYDLDKFAESDKFQRIYQSEGTEQLNDQGSATVPYFEVYEVL